MVPRIINKAAPTVPLSTNVETLDGFQGQIVLVRRRKFAKRYGVAIPHLGIRCALVRRTEFVVR